MACRYALFWKDSLGGFLWCLSVVLSLYHQGTYRDVLFVGISSYFHHSCLHLAWLLLWRHNKYTIHNNTTTTIQHINTIQYNNNINNMFNWSLTGLSLTILIRLTNPNDVFEIFLCGAFVWSWGRCVWLLLLPVHGCSHKGYLCYLLMQTRDCSCSGQIGHIPRKSFSRLKPWQ